MVCPVGRCTAGNGCIGYSRDTWTRGELEVMLTYELYTRDKVMDCRDIILVYMFVKFMCMLFVDSRISRQRWLYDG